MDANSASGEWMLQLCDGNANRRREKTKSENRATFHTERTHGFVYPVVRAHAVGRVADVELALAVKGARTCVLCGFKTI